MSGPSKERPSAGPPDVSTWSPWLHSGSHWDSSDACPHNRCPCGRGSRPSPLAVWAAGLVIVAEVPRPTLHVPHAHRRAAGQADGRVHRVHLLLTGSGLHVAGVASRAAVLAVLTAHGVRQLAAGPGPLRLGQQVCPTGQLVCWSQPMSLGWDGEALWAGTLSSPVTTCFPLLQCLLATHV